MKLQNRILWILSVLFLCVAGRKNRHLYRGKRCHCKAIVANINAALDKKLNAFRDELLKGALSLPTSSGRERLVNLKMKSLSHDFVRMSTTIHKHGVSLQKMRRRVSNYNSHMMANVTQHLGRLERTIANMTSTMFDMKAFMTSDSCDRRIKPTNSRTISNKVISPPMQYPRDCDEVYRSGGLRYPGDYFIYLKPNPTIEPFKVRCQMSNNSGWAVFQRRDGNAVDFYRTWKEYRDGFGDQTSDFWLGNEALHQLTANGDAMLRVEMKDWKGNSFYAEYDTFSLSDEQHSYSLKVGGYHGNSGDSLTSPWRSHDGQPFSTHDRDNDKRFYDNCAQDFHGAWWFRDCFQSHLNGKYNVRGTHQNYFAQDGILWKSIHPYESLRSTIMMTRPRRPNDTISSVKV